MSSTSFTLSDFYRGLAVSLVFVLTTGILTTIQTARAQPIQTDFNGDGYGDLAIGVPDENIGSIIDAGAANIIYGNFTSLGSGLNQLVSQDTSGILDSAETTDLFARSLASGDFNNDGKTDLAIGVPLEDIDGVANAGAVNILYGSTTGLISSNNQLWTQNTTGVLDVIEADDFFGRSLASGDFNNDGYCDLAIGVPGEDFDTVSSGAVNILYGSNFGLSASNNQFWTQNSPGIADTSEFGDFFGRSLVKGDLNNDGYDDLAVGVPFEDIGTVSNGGAVNVIYGSASGLSATGSQFWSQTSGGILDTAEENDQFGFVLSSADFNNDGYFDLAIGVPLEDIGTGTDNGIVNVIYGSNGGLSPTGNQAWNQNSAGILDTVETNDQFGTSLVAGDFNGDGSSDLAVGVPLEDLSTTSNAGAVNVIYGSTTSGLASTGNQVWSQNSAGILDTGESGDHFGASLASSTFAQQQD